MDSPSQVISDFDEEEPTLHDPANFIYKIFIKIRENDFKRGIENEETYLAFIFLISNLAQVQKEEIYDFLDFFKIKVCNSELKIALSLRSFDDFNVIFKGACCRASSDTISYMLSVFMVKYELKDIKFNFIIDESRKNYGNVNMDMCFKSISKHVVGIELKELLETNNLKDLTKLLKKKIYGASVLAKIQNEVDNLLIEKEIKLNEKIFIRILNLLLITKDVLDVNVKKYVHRNTMVKNVERAIHVEDPYRAKRICLFNATEGKIVAACRRLLKSKESKFKWMLSPRSQAARNFLNDDVKTKELFKEIDCPTLLETPELKEKFKVVLINLLGTLQGQHRLQYRLHSEESDSSTTERPPKKLFRFGNVENCINLKSGLINFYGATCYMNCIIQILFNIREFVDNLESLRGNENEKIAFIKFVHQNYYQIRSYNVDEENLPSHYFIMKNIIDNLIASEGMSGFTDKFKVPIHGDACEFFDILINYLPSEFKKLFDVRNAKYASYHLKLTVKQFKAKNFAQKVVGNLANCGINNKRHLPPYLVVGCERAKKIKKKCVKDDSRLNLTYNLKVLDESYELISIGNHVGNSIESGHWVAYCKNDLDRFYKLDDDKLVELISKEQLEKEVCKGFGIIVYQKVNHDFEPEAQVETQEEVDIDYSQIIPKPDEQIVSESNSMVSVKLNELCLRLYENLNMVGKENCIKFIKNSFGKNLSHEGYNNLMQRLENLRIDVSKYKNSYKSQKNRTFKKTLKKFYKEKGYCAEEEFKFSARYLIEPVEINSGKSDSEESHLSENTEEISEEPKRKVGRPKIEKITEMGETLKKKAMLEASQKVAGIKEALELAKKISKRLKARVTTELLTKVILAVGKGEEAEILKKLEQKDFSAIDSWEAFMLMLRIGLTVRDYKIIRRLCIDHGFKGFPSYDKIFMYKNRQTPDGIEVTDTSASISVQELSDITACSLIENVLGEEILKRLQEKEVSKDEKLRVKVLYSWGQDGSGDQRIYHQAGSEGQQINEKSLIAVTMVPVQLTILKADGQKIFKWRNLHAASCFWNRCLSLSYEKETDQAILETHKRIEAQIEELISCYFSFNDYNFEIDHEFHLSMLDGRVIKVLTETKAFCNCPCCQAKPTDFNKLENLTNGVFSPKEKAILHTISPLHTIINVVRNLYNIACRLNLGQKKKGVWRVTTEIDKLQYEKNRSEIRQKIWDAFKVKFDVPMPSGGNSITGSVCRRLLKEPVKLAQVLGLDQELVCRLAVILKVINCKFDINIDKFEKYSTDTFKLFIKRYEWYYMSCSLHKLLVHASMIMRLSPLPIGLLTEESQESKNKYYRNFRALFARKTSRKDNIRDVFTRLIFHSDPFVANYENMCKIRRGTSKNDIQMISSLPEDIKEFFEISDGYDKNCEESDIEEEKIDTRKYDVFEDLEDYVECFYATDEQAENQELYDNICKKTNFKDDVNYN